MQTYSYNLIDEAWIPVMQQGSAQVVELSLSQLFQRAPTLGRIAGEVPVMDGPLYRLLLAVIYSALRDYRQQYDGNWLDMWEDFWDRPGALSQEVLKYLEKHRDRFDLFHPEHPFMQGPPDPARVKEVSPIHLVLHFAYGPTLFDHHLSNDETFALTPAEAIRWLLVLLRFGLGGFVPGKQVNKGVSAKDAPCHRAVSLFVEGESLFQTLMLNLFPYDDYMEHQEHDLPLWEQDDPFPASVKERPPYGYLDYLTWPSRRVHLYPDMREGQLMVTRCTILPGIHFLTFRKGSACDDPKLHPFYHFYPKGKGIQVLSFQEGRALWRDSTSILQLGAKDSFYPPRVLKWVQELMNEDILEEDQGWGLRLLAVGAASEPGKKKYHFYREEALPVPPRYLKDDILVEKLKNAVNWAEQKWRDLQKATWSLLCVYMVAADSPEGCKIENETDKKIAQGWVDEVERYYWPQLDHPFYNLVYDLAQAVEANEGNRRAQEEAADNVMANWSKILRKAVDSSYATVADALGNTVLALKARTLAKPYLYGWRPSRKSKSRKKKSG